MVVGRLPLDGDVSWLPTGKGRWQTGVSDRRLAPAGRRRRGLWAWRLVGGVERGP